MYINIHKILLVFIFLNFAVALTELIDVEVEHNCIQKCPLQNRTDETHYELDCGYECSISKCVEGCKLWKHALESSCQTVCNGTIEPLSPKELYCVMGCNDALTRYFSQLRAKLGTPLAPALVADSLTATSLSLEWKFPEARHAGLTYFVQWRYEELAASWQYCRNQTWGPHDTVIVDNLQPYTKYRFRVALLLSPHSEPIVSAPSVVISTLPAGVPASPPIIVRAVSIDCTHISVSWEPGPFPHGPLLSYVLHITDNHGYSALKDIPAENNFYMYRDLFAARNYTISISMTNGVGTGPAAQAMVSTPAELIAREVQQPVLILSSDHVVIEQGTDMLEVPVVLYRTEKVIKGIAIHVKQRLLFISNSVSEVHRITFTNFTNQSQSTTILAPPHINFLPSELSVDWLNDQLYILGEVTHQRQVWQITRCDLDGRGMQVAIAGLRIKPHYIEVDPYNGFLFWAVHGKTGGGLFRLDLSDISNGIKHNVQPELILAEPNLGAFTVDHTNFRLLCSNQDQNTINSVSLDGKEIVNVRPKIITRKMQKVLSLATANKTFYWTDGNDVFYEEFHPSRESYYHNAYPDLADRPYLKVIVNLQSSQPTPIPINPPTSLQAIFGSQLVKITWKVPHLLGEQGKGAWQNWSYEVSIKEVDSNRIKTHKGINITASTINNLKENTDYIIKAAAYTDLGKGPWSSEFRGKTLKLPKSGKYPIILWSTSNGLLKSDATGENVQTIIHKKTMKDSYITDIAWYNDKIYLVTNNSQIFWHNINNNKFGQISDIDSVGSIAIDWIGKKLYWSNPKQQLILRGNFNGTQQEPLPILTLAKELNIDAVQAYLYWSTGHAVECARLNGADRFVYHPAQLFSGKQVMGLTLDMNHNMVYWIIRGSEGSNLFRAPMAGYFPTGMKPAPESISNLQKPDMQGPLCYFNDRLLWLKDEENAVISDLTGKNVANINGKELSGLTMIYIMDSTLYTWPNTTNKLVSNLSVIPESIDVSSVRAAGSWNSFNITWEPCHRVNYGTVFYEIKVDSLLKNGSTKITTTPYIKYWQTVAPFTKLHVTIKAYTYWGTSPLIRAKIYSPPSTPSAPGNLRSYVSHNKYRNEEEVLVTFRWDEPSNSNGVIQGYKIKCWYVENFMEVEVCQNAIGKPNEREYVTTNLQNDEVYYFQVQAFTEIGDGEVSQILSVNTCCEFPLPKLLVASGEAIFIQDIDKNVNYPVLRGISTPIEIGYIMKENKLFWINDLQELLMFNLISLNRSKIADLNGNTISLTIDWLERSIYYAQIIEDGQGTTVYKINLNHIERGILKSVEIFTTPSVITKIEISPFTQKLYWVEIDYTGQYHLMQSNANGKNIQAFFSTHFYNKRSVDSNFSSCNCPVYPSVEKTFTLDHSNAENKPSLIFIDSDSQNIVSADKYGCNCSILVPSDLIGDSLPLETIKSDFETLYWTNKGEGLVFSLKRNETQVVTKEQINAQDILILGSHMQPYPPNNCLMPKSIDNVTVSLLQKSSTTLKILMPKDEQDDECQNISLPTTEYKIYYTENIDGELTQCNESCNHLVTFEKEVEIEKLEPFTKYVIFVEVYNYYSLLMEENATMGPATIFQTSVGPPSKPGNITAVVLNPTIIEVSWAPPKKINGESVWYEIHWQTEGGVNGIRQKGEQVLSTLEVKKIKDYFHAQLYKLLPNETYLVWVRAYSQTNDIVNDSNNLQVAFSESNSVKIKTYPEPSNITLLSYTSTELHIQLKQYEYAKEYVLQYSLLILDDWLDVINDTYILLNDTINVRVDGLKPKTQYKFRMVLFYPNYLEPYIWPKDTRFTFETLGDRPSPPGMPKIKRLKRDVYQVWWEPSEENGAPIEMYLLEGLKLPNYRNKRSAERPPWFENAPSVEEPEYTWIPLYNGTDRFWIISGLQDQYRYAFRVSSYNSYGWSNTSEESMEFDLNIAAQIAEKQDPINLLLITGIPLLVCLSVVICFFSCKWYCTKDNKKQLVAIPRGPDVELATLRELPRRWIHNTNILYTTNQLTPDEITMLPHIRRDQISLMKFLGSGAFGEVYEGKAKYLGENDSEINVAIKTLRKGASDTEKCEFLQEAQLMSHFKHEHILQLLGVCLDNDPQFIIMELMQGGDLLTYLRSSRNPMTSVPTLTLTELLKMCVDVARGCRYLEEMHFVHRDLACRNCLVSSTNPDSRIVKIGDFGLTRDIYKNDYYRKEGEGLLPVRWMAPESLVDGVFTCQSDVWAFGVLLWEIMTLGQQPYPVRSNLEVLHYVKSGGRLGKPTDCPEKLHELMLKCWYSEPERRPTFKFCLTMLEDLLKEVVSEPPSGAHNGQYISTIPFSEGVFNRAYFQDIFDLKSAHSWKNGSDEDSEREQTPFLQAEGETKIPTYLELIYDSNYPEENDGYEVPRSSIQSLKAESNKKLPQPSTNNSITDNLVTPKPNVPLQNNTNTEDNSKSENHFYVNQETELGSDKK